MEARLVLGVLLIFYHGSSQGMLMGKRSIDQASNLETELRRVKRPDEDPGLSRMKRDNLDDAPSLSREKRRDLEDQVLSRVKRYDLAEDPALSRQKRRDVDDDGLMRVKRGDLLDNGLSRQKRQDMDEDVQLSRVKRGDEGLMRVKRTDVDLPELNRVKRGESSPNRRRRNADVSGDTKEVDKTDVAKAEASTEDGPVKRTHVELDLSKSDQTKVEKKSSDEMVALKRKRGYWEKRSRGDYLLHRANKRGKYHKRRYMNKRGRGRFMKRKSLAKQKLHREAQKKLSEKDFMKKSLAKNAKHQ